MEQDVGNTDDAAIDLSFEKDIRQLLRAATGCGRIPKKNLENVRREHERLAAVKTQRNIQAKWSSWMMARSTKRPIAPAMPGQWLSGWIII